MKKAATAKLTSAFTLCALVLACGAALAKPSSDEMKKVLDYYYNGEGQGAVLVEYKFCEDVLREGPNKNECSAELAASPAKDQPVFLWMAYSLPKNESDRDILIQMNHNGITREVQSVQINGSLRYRTWKRIVFKKSGKWELKITQDGDNGDMDVLADLQVEVAE